MAQDLREIHGLACPRCGQAEQLRVRVTSWAWLEGSTIELGAPSDAEWGSNSDMMCGECEWSGLAHEASVPPKLEEGPPPYDAATATGMYD